MSKPNLFAKADRNIAARTDRGGHEAPPLPATCSVTRCENEAAVVLAVCDVEGRGRVTGAGSDFMGAGRVMRSGVTFVQWISRCAECYTKDLQRTKRGVYAHITDNPNGIPTLEEVRALR
jgi:hypothetical protein